MNRNVLLACAATLALGLFSSAASAGDWDGFYAGAELGANTVAPHGHGGGIIDNFRSSFHEPQSLGVVAGGIAGYNWQDDRWVYGFEGDLAYLGNDHSTECGSGYFTCSFKQNWEGSLDARAGYVEGNALFFIKGGVSFSHYDVSIYNSELGKVSDGKSVTGWNFGGGVDAIVCPNVVVGGSIQYSNYGDNTLHLYTDQVDAPTDVSVTARVAWQFH